MDISINGIFYHTYTKYMNITQVIFKSIVKKKPLILLDKVYESMREITVVEKEPSFVSKHF